MTERHAVERDAQRIIAEALCPPSHREGMAVHIVGQPAKIGPLHICTLHAIMAKNVTRALIEARVIPREGSSAEKDARCDHPGLDHSERWSHCWPCPACGVCKFIGHGPLCGDCHSSSVMPPATPPAPDAEVGK